MTRHYRLIPVLAVAAASVLGACSHNSQGVPTHRLHPTVVAESVERLELYARPNGMSLSARDHTAVAQFLQTYAASGTGPIFINRPASHRGGLGVMETDRLLRTVMADVGLDPRVAESGEYHVAPGNPAPVVVTYKTLRTVRQDCTYTQDVANAANNGVRPGFGCFMSANLAAMIADPAQLIAPLPNGTPNAQRRQVVYDKYIKGEPTAAARPDGQRQNSRSNGT